MAADNMSESVQSEAVPLGRKARKQRPVSCGNCGKTIYRHPSRLESFNRHYCCLACKWAAMVGDKQSDETRQKRSDALSGEKSPNWKGGTSARYRRGYKSQALKAWRCAVFERDDHTCQDCGQRGGKLNAHHIKPWSKFPELRYVVANGVTLCERCHEKRDPFFHRAKQIDAGGC